MLAATALGTAAFYLAVLPAVYWSYDHRIGYQFGFILLIVGSLNALGKLAFHLPRPYWIDTRVRAYLHEATFGMPSGHAQISLAVFGLVGVYFRSRLAWVLILLLIFMIGFSRIFLGVHFPSDVLLGWWIGAILLVGIFVFRRGRTSVDAGSSSTRILVIYFLLSFGILLAGLLAVEWIASAGWVLPDEWISNAMAAFPNRDPIDPMNIETLAISTGALFGFLLGGQILESYQAKGPILKRLLRYFLGMSGIGVLYAVTMPLTFVDDGWLGAGLQFGRFALVGLWISWWAPLLFIRLGLAEKPMPSPG